MRGFRRYALITEINHWWDMCPGGIIRAVVADKDTSAPALQYLAAAGVGTIGIVDDDTVENANLQRQVIHTEEGIGSPKVFSAKAQMLLDRVEPVLKSTLIMNLNLH